MEYRFTDMFKATVTFDLTLGQIDDLRQLLEKVHAAQIEGVSGWRVREMVRKLADAQRMAADLIAIDAKALAERAAEEKI